MNEQAPAEYEREPRAKDRRPLLFLASVIASVSFFFAAYTLLVWDRAYLGFPIAIASLGGILGGTFASYRRHSICWMAFLLPLAVALFVVVLPTVGDALPRER